jgi:hypothetical protein
MHAVRGHQRPVEASRGHQRPSEATDLIRRLLDGEPLEHIAQHAVEQLVQLEQLERAVQPDRATSQALEPPFVRQSGRQP